MTSSKEAVRKTYNLLSHWYDWLAGSERHSKESSLRMLNVQPGEKVLEIGFGTGWGLVALAHSAGEIGRVYGIDLSEGMFEVAQAKITRAGLSDRVEIRLGDAVNLPFKDDFFDAIFMSFTLELFDTPEIPLVLGECKRVLHEDGRIGVVALEKKEIRVVRIYEWFHTLIPTIVDCRPINLRRIIEAAGFEPSEGSEEVIWGLPVAIIKARKRG